MTNLGFSAVGGSIETNHDATNAAIRSVYHKLVDSVFDGSSGKLYLRMILKASNGLVGKLVTNSSFANVDGSYAGFGFCKSESSNHYLLSTSSSSIFFAVSKDSNGTPVLSLCIRDTGGNLHTYTLDPDVTPPASSIPYICYAEISVNAGANGAERIRAGSKKVADFNSVDTLDWKTLSGSDTTVEVDFITGSAYPDAMAMTGPCGTAGGFLRADEIFVTTTLSELLNFGAESSGTPAVSRNSFSTSWKLIAKPSVAVDADLYLSENEGFLSPTVIPIGTGLLAGSHTAEATGLDSLKTYWWKIVATCGDDTTETKVGSFRTFYGGDLYVSAGNAGAEEPYDTPATAASKIGDAVAIADNGTTIHVTPGLYKISTPIEVPRAIRIVGEGDTPSAVVVTNVEKNTSYGRNARLFTVTSPGAWISGLTMTKGYLDVAGSSQGGGGLYLGAGTVSNCVVLASAAKQSSSSTAKGGGVHVGGASALMTHCIISNCQARESDASWAAVGAAGVYVDSGRIENCLVLDCVDANDSPTLEKLAGGILLKNATASAVNCTVIGCVGCRAGGILVENAAATVRNCVSFDCRKRLKVDGEIVVSSSPFAGTVAAFDHCASDATATYNQNETILGLTSAAFRDYANGDYAPVPGGPLVNKGVNYEGMAAVDLAGERRLIGSKVDIGCYEGNIAGTYIRLR